MGKKAKGQNRPKAKATEDGLHQTALLVSEAINMQLEHDIEVFKNSKDPRSKFFNDKMLNVSIKWLTMNDYKVKDEVLEKTSERSKELRKIRKLQGSAALRVVGGN